MKVASLLAVTIWIAERAREIAESASYQQRGETGARRKKPEGHEEKVSPSFDFFARLFLARSRLSRKGLLTV